MGDKMIKKLNAITITAGIGLCCVVLCGCASMSYRAAFTNALAGEVATGNLIGNQWISLVGSNITYDDAWLKVVNTIGEVYEIEVLEKESGYLRTVTKEREIRFKHGDDLSGWQWVGADFRSAIIVRCTSKDPPSFKIKIDNESYNGGWKPMKEIFKEDARIISEIRALLGVPGE